MSHSQATTDMGVGLAAVFGVLALVGALAMAGTAYLAVLNGVYAFQLLSGVALAVTLVFGALAIAALHRYAE